MFLPKRLYTDFQAPMTTLKLKKKTKFRLFTELFYISTLDYVKRLAYIFYYSHLIFKMLNLKLISRLNKKKH